MTSRRLIEQLHSLYPEASRRSLKHWLTSARVRVNGTVVVRGDAEVEPGDRVELASPLPPPIPSPLRLVHEDDDILVIDKPSGLLTIATQSERERTAYRLLRNWFSRRGARPSQLFIVHRLDRETSGLLVFAKSVAAKEHLQMQFAVRTAERLYVALAEGVMRQDEGSFVSRLVETRALRVRVAQRGGGREAITRYRVLERRRASTLVELRLVTGRRAQIRAQLAAAGHPIAGDAQYGSRTDPLKRLALHATRLAFVHPRGGRMSFESPPPTAFAHRT
ncbi:MAG TPA: RluA family pseudouridine synthase [Methylomirabilota bacterium]|jgi:23S rRNA pseudouridine1911/1915/1917 synthase